VLASLCSKSQSKKGGENMPRKSKKSVHESKKSNERKGNRRSQKENEGVMEKIKDIWE
jgi:hypothetical protein